jgi:hypothetical protein
LPSSNTLLEAALLAFHSPLVPSGVSDFDHCNRELQSVECKFGICFDHTFGAMANYNKKTLKVGNGACFMTCMVETGECPGAIMVPSTRLRDAAHWVQQLSERPKFGPKAMWNDVHPNGIHFWQLFWKYIHGHLGIFHWTQWIVRTMHQRHPDYGKAVAALSDCVYFFYPPDEDAVQQALLAGTMNSEGPLNHDDIVILKREGTFKKRYTEYIQKVIYSASMIRTKLTAWFADFKAKASADSKLPAGGARSQLDGTSLFTPETCDAYENCLRTCHYLQDDPFTIEEVYRKQNPPPGAKHGLPVYRAQRGESNLESLHFMFSNYANGGMRPSIADMLNLKGLTRHNVQQWQKLKVGTMTAEEMQQVPAHLREIPLHYDHSNLAYINGLAASAGATEPHFKVVRNLPDDNGERFLSAYLKEQLERYRLYGEHEINDLCQCPRCLEARPPPELAGQSQNDTGIAQLPPLDMEEVMEEPTSQDGEGLGAATSSDGDIEYGADFSDDGDTVEVVEAPTETRTALPKSLPALAPKPTPPVPLFQAYQRTHPFSSPYLPTLYPPNMPHQHGYHHPTMPSVPHYYLGSQHTAYSPMLPVPTEAAKPHRSKPQREYCCEQYRHYIQVVKPSKGSKAGRPPHSVACTASMGDRK